MDESIEVGEGVGVEVVDDVDGVLGSNAFVALDLCELGLFELMKE